MWCGGCSAGGMRYSGVVDGGNGDSRGGRGRERCRGGVEENL